MTSYSTDPPPLRKLTPKSAWAVKKFIKPALDVYHVDAVPYESLMVVLLSVEQRPLAGEPKKNCPCMAGPQKTEVRPKITDRPYFPHKAVPSFGIKFP